MEASTRMTRFVFFVTLTCWIASAVRSGHVGSRKRKPPTLLLDMYEKFSQGKHEEGNAVHALFPIDDALNTYPGMLLFNLTAIHPQEKLRVAHLHVHRRLLARRFRAGSLRMRLCQITNQRVAVLEDIILNLNTTGWQEFDVSAAVQHVHSSPHRLPHLLCLRVELKRPGSSAFRSVRPRRIKHLRLQPFIVAFTDDGFTIEEDIQHNFLHAPDRLKAERNSRLKMDGTDIGTTVLSSGDFPNFGFRARRSVSDNRVPEGDAKLKPGAYFSYTIDGSKNDDVTLFSSHGAVSNGLLDDVRISEEATTQAIVKNHAHRLIPYPTKTKPPRWRRRKQKRRRHHGRKRKLLKGRRLPSDWNATRPNATVPPTRTCRRHRLTIDFEAIGWGEWIINPPRFDAFYCGGTCRFPLSKDSRPTNHATVQSLAAMLGVTSAGGGTGGGTVPAPCCVPDSLDSLTLLYFDQTKQNVVLKNYPKMVVKSCSCR